MDEYELKQIECFCGLGERLDVVYGEGESYPFAQCFTCCDIRKVDVKKYKERLNNALETERKMKQKHNYKKISEAKPKNEQLCIIHKKITNYPMEFYRAPNGVEIWLEQKTGYACRVMPGDEWTAAE